VVWLPTLNKWKPSQQVACEHFDTQKERKKEHATKTTPARMKETW
jgi:hypothetical protein